MDALVGFHVGFWDYATFAVLFIVAIAGLVVFVLILGVCAEN
jgi:hypothetical protein